MDIKEEEAKKFEEHLRKIEAEAEAEAEYYRDLAEAGKDISHEDDQN